MIVVIDGPSGSGKSTLAKRLAEDLQFDLFDTGAMYRSVCLFLMQKNISLKDTTKIQEALESFQYEIQGHRDQSEFFVNGQNVSKEIRSREVTNNVSVIAAYPFVREKLVSLQKSFGSKGNAIFEGRDMGTVVFPNAEVKFFLIANAKVRAERRCRQLQELYPDTSFDQAQIEKEIIERDATDSSRECSPLKQAEDAIKIDASEMSINEVLELMKKHIKEHNV